MHRYFPFFVHHYLPKIVHICFPVTTDRKKVGINVLAYVFAALKDPDNGNSFIKYGYDTPQLKTFYSEFGIKVTERLPRNPPANSTGIRNLTKITSKGKLENRELNDVYKDFRLRYKEKLKEHKLL